VRVKYKILKRMREGEREKERKINYTNKFWPKKLEV